MNKKLMLCSILVIVAIVLTGCQAAATASVASAASDTNFQRPQGTPPAGFSPRQAAATATATATATARPTATATATAVPVTAGAESAARAYFAALASKDFSSAARLVSIFSLSFAQMTRSDAASQLLALSKAGAAWSDLKVVDSQVFSDGLVLVHVTYQQANSSATATATATTADAALDNGQKDELWPFKLENGAWLYNWNNLIDTKTLDVQSQTAYHITVKPTQLVRYSDRIELHFMMQNQTGDVMYFVQPYDSLAVFHFGDQEVEAEKSTTIVVSGLRTAFDETIVVKGLYASYPTWVEMRKWKGYAVNPWYTFQF